MKLDKVTFDANIFITEGVSFADLPSNFYLSAVVMSELVISAPDASAVKALRRTYLAYQKKERILIPTTEDWWEVGKILYSLQHNRRDSRTGNIPKIEAGERVRITNDTLIARTAKAAGITVITNNLRDFEKIKTYCPVNFYPAAEYFRR